MTRTDFSKNQHVLATDVVAFELSNSCTHPKIEKYVNPDVHISPGKRLAVLS
jgi:hypothetical protein